MSIAHRGKVFSERHRLNLSIATTGFRHSKESKRKMSEQRKGMVSPRKGCKLLPAQLAKMSASRKGKPISEETKQKIRETNIRTNSVLRLRTGRPVWNKGKKGVQVWSEESKKRQSETLKRIGHRPPLIKGDKHYKWKGGVTPEKMKVRNSLEYKLWRKAVFSRDNWTCQKYHVKGGLLHAHHIVSFHADLDLRLSVDNGVTLSHRAHMEFHNIYGRSNNTPEQLKEFLAAEPLQKAA